KLLCGAILRSATLRERTTPPSILNNSGILVELFFSLFDKSTSVYSFQLPCHPVRFEGLEQNYKQKDDLSPKS
uniref:hypothetical protein n=1 Tax=Okeania sp. SIO2F4 TaxID=2607790 RepID=UPI0025D3BF73